MLGAEVEAALEQRPDLRVVKLPDAARDNWSFLGQLAPQAAISEEFVDFFHAAEHLKAAPELLYISPSFLGIGRVEVPHSTIRSAMPRTTGIRSVDVGRHHVKPLRGSYASLRPCG